MRTRSTRAGGGRGNAPAPTTGHLQLDFKVLLKGYKGIIGPTTPGNILTNSHFRSSRRNSHLRNQPSRGMRRNSTTRMTGRASRAEVPGVRRHLGPKRDMYGSGTNPRQDHSPTLDQNHILGRVQGVPAARGRPAQVVIQDAAVAVVVRNRAPAPDLSRSLLASQVARFYAQHLKRC